MRLIIKIHYIWEVIVTIQNWLFYVHTKMCFIVEATLSNVRMRYWITKGRQTVNAVLKNSFIFHFVKEKFIVPPKAPSLPNFRVNCFSAFESVGVDFAGPLSVKGIYSRNDNLNKCYLLLFTCTTTWALFTFENYTRCFWNTLSLGAHQNWFVPIFIKMFNHLNLLLGLRSIRIAWWAVSVWGALFPTDPKICTILTHFCPHKYYIWNFVAKNTY